MPARPLAIPDGIKDLTDLVVYDSGRCTHVGGLADVTVGEFKGLKVAVKLFRFDNQDKEKFKRRFGRELNTWATLQRDRHENILEILGILNWNASDARIAIVSPYQENGTVLEYVKSNSKADKKFLVLQIAKGLQHIHSRGIVHGDLKANNVLISESGDALIADFGQSRIIDHEAYTTFTGHRHTVIYLAPEIISYLSDVTTEDIDALKVNTKESDVYAFSITAAEVLRGEEYKELSRFPVYGIYKRVVERNFRPSDIDIPKTHYTLLTECWTADVDRRPKIDTIVKMLGSVKFR